MKNIAIIILLTTTLFGAPAIKKEISFKQADGSSFKGKIKGDEWFNWVQTNDGYISKYNKQSKNYEYMIFKQENNKYKLKYSNIKVNATPSNSQAAAIHNIPAQIKKIPYSELNKIWKQKRKEINLNRNPNY